MAVWRLSLEMCVRRTRADDDARPSQGTKVPSRSHSADRPPPTLTPNVIGSSRLVWPAFGRCGLTCLTMPLALRSAGSDACRSSMLLSIQATPVHVKAEMEDIARRTSSRCGCLHSCLMVQHRNVWFRPDSVTSSMRLKEEGSAWRRVIPSSDVLLRQGSDRGCGCERRVNGNVVSEGFRSALKAGRPTRRRQPSGVRLWACWQRRDGIRSGQ